MTIKHNCSLIVVALVALVKGVAAEGTDLEIRFSKTPFINASLASLYLPLTKEDYPIQGDIATVLKTLTNAASPLLPNDPEVKNEPILPKERKKVEPESFHLSWISRRTSYLSHHG
jgi:hypothetical protein